MISADTAWDLRKRDEEPSCQLMATNQWLQSRRRMGRSRRGRTSSMKGNRGSSTAAPSTSLPRTTVTPSPRQYNSEQGNVSAKKKMFFREEGDAEKHVFLLKKSRFTSGIRANMTSLVTAAPLV